MKKSNSTLSLLLTAVVAVAVLAAGAFAQSKGVNYSAVPSKTIVNGKSVELKSYPDGLKYYDITVGSGAHPKAGQTVSVSYYGTTIDGKVFDATVLHGNQPLQYQVGEGQVIPGWDEGVLGMKVGGKRRLVIPGALAFGGNSPTPTIPANATLIFDVKLISAQ